jgi:hypothetical protein
MRDSSDHGFDTEIDFTYVEVKSGLNAVRNLRAGLLDLAYVLQSHPNHHGLLVLADTNITTGRVEREWDLARQTLRSEVFSRLGILTYEAGEFRGYPDVPPQSFLDQLLEIVRRETSDAGRRMPRPDYYSEILKLLICHWFQKEEPITIASLETKIGCTYPTVAKTLDKFSLYLFRSSDRRVALNSFPKAAWAALITRGDEVRQTKRYVDRSGQLRSPDNLARRVAKLGRRDLALGGVLGARSHYPNLDLLGTPRLDLTMHCPGSRFDLEFIARLDPGLVLATSAQEPAALVVHALRRKEPLFSAMPEGGWRADPVECLLDLHEARLESQAAEFFNALAPTPHSL